jgi:hypothetical protein
LAVDDRCGWLGLTSSNKPRGIHKRRVDDVQEPTIARAIEALLHRCAGWEILGQRRPLATCRGNVGNGVPDLAHRMLAGTTYGGGRRQKWRD